MAGALRHHARHALHLDAAALAAAAVSAFALASANSRRDTWPSGHTPPPTRPGRRVAWSGILSAHRSPLAFCEPVAPRVGVCGDVFVDVMAKVQGLPAWDSDTEAAFIKVLPGGSALNQARTMHALGLDVRFLGAIGGDSFGEMLTRHVEAQGFSMRFTKVFRGLPSSACLVLAGPSDRAFVSCYSTTDAFGAGDLEEREHEALEGCCHFHIGGYFNLKGLMNPGLTGVVRRCRDRGMSVSLNTQYDASDLWTGTDGHLRELLPLVDFLFVNEVEAGKIAANLLGGAAAVADGAAIREGSPEALCDEFRGLTLVMTRGKQGVDIFRHGRPTLHVPSEPAACIVDTTGAGDAFIGGFLSAWLAVPASGRGGGQEARLAEAAARGNAAARVCIGREGACVEPVRPHDLGLD